jgi:hypothetical protein
MHDQYDLKAGVGIEGFTRRPLAMNRTLTSPRPSPLPMQGAERETRARFRGSEREIRFGAFSPSVSAQKLWRTAQRAVPTTNKRQPQNFK